MAYKPWEVRDNLWKERCKWGGNQSKSFLVGRMAERTGKSIFDTLRDLSLAEDFDMVTTNDDGSVDINL